MWQVYPVPGHVITKNHLRAAKMWMEPKYFDLVKRANSPLPAGVEIGDISWGTEIKERVSHIGPQRALHWNSLCWHPRYWNGVAGPPDFSDPFVADRCFALYPCILPVV